MRRDGIGWGYFPRLRDDLDNNRSYNVNSFRVDIRANCIHPASVWHVTVLCWRQEVWAGHSVQCWWSGTFQTKHKIRDPTSSSMKQNKSFWFVETSTNLSWISLATFLWHIKQVRIDVTTQFHLLSLCHLWKILAIGTTSIFSHLPLVRTKETMKTFYSRFGLQSSEPIPLWFS